MNDPFYDEEVEKYRVKKLIDEKNSSVKKLIGPNGKIVNGCSLDFDVAFGINYTQISNQLMILGDGYIIFSSGTTVVVRDLTSRTNMFLAKENRLKNVTALGAMMKKKQSAVVGHLVVAIGESTLYDDKPVMVSVVSTKKNKWFTLLPGCKGTVKYICITGNTEKKYCAVLVHQTNSNMPYMYFYNYRKEKLLASAAIKASFEKFTLHPQKPKNLILTGNSYFRMWENYFQDRQIKESHISLVSLKIEKENKFLDQTWIMIGQIPTLVVLANGNKVFIIQNDDHKKTIEIDTLNMNILEVNVDEMPTEENDEMYRINNLIEDYTKEKPQQKETLPMSQLEKIDKSAHSNIEFNCITGTRNGFIVGGNKGCLSLYNLEKNFTLVNTLSFQMKFQNKEENKIISIYSSAQDSLVSIVSIYGKEQLNFSLLNTYHLDSEISPIQPFFPIGFHTKKINSMSCSSCKSIFATSSEDNTVKIWNYYDSETTEKKGVMTQEFKEEPLSLSMHPSGLYIAICFTNCFKVFAILNDSFYLIKEVNLTNCKIVKYSHGGSFLLTNEKSNILIFDSIYYETLYILDGHTALIKDACISDDDFFVVSTCMSGFVYCWNLVEELNPSSGLKNPEHQENTIYNCIQFDHNCNSKLPDYFVGASNDKYLSIYKNRCHDLIAEFPTTDCYITTLLVSSKKGVIFMGTNKGSIRISLWPIDDETMEWEMMNASQVKFKVPEYYEVQAHAAAITCLCLSHDLNYLFSGAEDGTLFVFKLKGSELESHLETDDKKNSSNALKIEDKTKSLNDLFLAKVLKIMDTNEIIKQYTFEVIKYEQKVKIDMQRIEIDYKKSSEKNLEDFQTNYENEKKKRERFEEKSNEDLAALRLQLSQDRSQFDKELKELEVLHQSKVDYENQRNQESEEKIEAVKIEQQNELMKMLEKYEIDKQNLRAAYQEKCEKIQVKYSSVVDNAKNFGNAFIQRLDKEDQEHEMELEDQVKELKERKQNAIKMNNEQRAKNVKLIEENEASKAKDAEMQKELERLIGEFNKIRIDNVKNDESIIKMNHQLVERMQVIDSKDETCKAAKDEQINLENFRYMLDQKIKMLQNEKGQILTKITEKEKNLKDMFNELIKESGQNESKFKDYKRQLVEIDILEESIKKSDLDIFLNSNRLNGYRNNLMAILKHPDKMVPMADKLSKMLEKSKDDDQLKSITTKRHITNDDINDIIRITNEKGDDINDEIFKQGKWMAKKHYLIKKTCDQLEKIRDENMVCVLNQNTKLIEECNALRSENDKYRKLTRNVEKLLAEAIRKKQKLIKKKRESSPTQLKKLVKKYEENSDKLKSQNKKLTELKESMNEMILKNQEEDQSTRFPPIGKGGVSQSLVNLSSEGQKAQAKPKKQPPKKENKVEVSEIKVEDQIKGAENQ